MPIAAFSNIRLETLDFNQIIGVSFSESTRVQNMLAIFVLTRLLMSMEFLNIVQIQLGHRVIFEYDVLSWLSKLLHLETASFTVDSNYDEDETYHYD